MFATSFSDPVPESWTTATRVQGLHSFKGLAPHLDSLKRAKEGLVPGNARTECEYARAQSELYVMAGEFIATFDSDLKVLTEAMKNRKDIQKAELDWIGSLLDTRVLLIE